MKLLLDTHVFLWFISGDAKLRPELRDAIQDAANEVYLSVASVWEAVIKSQLGKLSLPQPAEIYLPEQRIRHHIASLEIDEVTVVELAQLPSIHRDPFDRILIAQARRHEMKLATVDPLIRSYPVDLF